MRVDLITEADDDFSIGVYLDDGTEVGRYAVVDNPAVEAEEMRSMLSRVVNEMREKCIDAAEDWSSKRDLLYTTERIMAVPTFGPRKP